MAGTISSLGVGSGILTQSIIDQLRAADEAARIAPLEKKIIEAQAKESALSTIDGWMSDLAASIETLRSQSLYDERTANVTGTAVSVTAQPNTDLQSFTLSVTNLATKEINESGSFATRTDPFASAAGSMNLNIDGTDFTINYDGTMSLDDLKNEINTVAGDKVNATVIQLADNDFRLFISSVNTGSTQDITITDTTGNLLGTQLTTGMTTVQNGVDANFTFNGQAVTRSTNEFSDLVTGLTITLENEGQTSTVDIVQNRDSIIEKMEDFVEKFNTAMGGIAGMTYADADTAEIFSGESMIKSIKRDLTYLLSSLGEGQSLYDYGFDLDKEGKLSFDADAFGIKLDENAANVEAFFAGGTFTNPDATTQTLTGFFVEYQTGIENYTAFNGLLDSISSSFDERTQSLEDQKTRTLEFIDARYETLIKQFQAYDAMISRINQQGAFLSQMISQANATKE